MAPLCTTFLSLIQHQDGNLNVPQRTQIFRQVPWIGGINTSVDSGVLNPQELVTADNVVFTATGARIKREALEYLDHDIPAPDFKSSSGTTRTLKWTTNALVNIQPLDERLVSGEKINVTGDTNYNIIQGTILTRNEIREVSSVTAVADISGSLAGKYFTFSSGDLRTDYYVWFKVSGSGTDPVIANKTGIEVDISTNATASTVASSAISAINSAASTDVTASAVSAVITLTNTTGGETASGTAGTSGFTFSVTIKGGHSITYEGNSSLTQSAAIAAGIAIARASKVISFTDYWRFNGATNEQLGVFVTNNFQLFTIDGSGRRVQIHGQEKTTAVTTTGGAAATGTIGFTANPVGTQATGTITFTANPSSPDTITVGGTAITFVASGPVGNQVLVGASADATLNNLLSFLQNSTDTNIIKCTYAKASVGEIINVAFALPGPTGNAFTLAKSSTSITLSGSTLSSGANDTLTVNGTTITFVQSSPSGNQVLIGATGSLTLQSLLTLLQTSSDANIILSTYTADPNGTTIDVKYTLGGTVGNAFTLTKSSAAITLSGATLSGGAAITSGAHFLINGPNDLTNYYVWFNVSSGGGDPHVSARTGIEVDITSTSTANDIATAIASGINASLSGFTATATSNVATITAPAAGIAADSVDVNTTFTLTTTLEGATVPSAVLETAKTLIFNNRLQIALSGLGNLPIFFSPDQFTKYQLLPNAPDMSTIWEFQGRMWGNQKTDPDFVNYSPPFDDSTWGGIGDSGGFFIGAGDGDPEGITNGYKYKDLMVVSKLHNRYRIVGDAPETYTVEAITEGLGNEGALSIPVDETDVVFLSHRGIHSQAATDSYGDTSSKYLSANIKPTFNQWESSLLKFSQGAWIPELNSFAISVAEQGQPEQNAVWLYNVQIQVPNSPSPGAWYRWPGISCTALSRRYIDAAYKLIFGTSDGRIIQSQKQNSFTDFGDAGIPYRVKTGTVYCDNDPQTFKAYKKVSLLYRPKGNFSFNVSIKIDNFPAQAFSFNQISGLDLLGETFILGSSLLGSSATLAPFTFSMDGVGRGFTMEITQPSQEEQIEVWGFMIEWEPAGTAQEVV